ncbi:uncharacterized protein C8A04DRAFT_24060 [Dichotomopilus funicola]|uniref:FAD-binding PCMH-type domain-containing protein n=1 Tax=Dichotomopilus funicola TaxID=1934379 RepID=A0AAN6VBC3_9PEZI|nr:hypothetical protein C8A04DRAFT_24060 [Dichotomopilus funicola]
MIASLIAGGLLAFSVLAVEVNITTSIGLAECKCFPGDACWPLLDDWSLLNQTVDGRLIATTPLARPCHDPNYDQAECKVLQDGWQNPATHMDDSASVMAPFFANQSCDPFTAESKPCTLGNYVVYTVEASSADDVVAAVKFATQHNIRFVIRNTGHDYLGRSTGAGALSVWTHKLKDIEFVGWNDAGYEGSAVKLGAGIQGFEAMEATRARGQVLLSGECPTVGVAGGYTQGGGHSALSTSFGLSADNTLEFDVVTADGQLLTASKSQNSDLYWALSGGGGGNYGVVVSMTVKTFPEAQVGGGTIAFYANENPTENFYAAIDAFHAALPDMIASEAMVVYYFTSSFFQIAPLTAYNKTAAEVQSILAPFVAKLNSMGIVFTSNYTQSATYYDHYNQYFGPLPVGNIQVGIAQYGGRLVPLSAFQNNASAMSSVARYIAEKNVTWIGVGTDVSRFGGDGSNAVLPAWRTPLVHATLTTVWSFDPAEWDDMLANQQLMTDDIMPRIEDVTPGSGAYMNEADFRQPGFQYAFFGSNYETLLQIKQKYDPDGFFYATKAVGSEMWTVGPDGKMCAASS